MSAAAGTAAASVLPERVVTVRPAPRREPPFDDEPAARHLHAVGPLDRRLPFETPVRPPLLLYPPGRRTVDPTLPDPARWGRRLLIVISETAAGHRPLQQLATLLSPAVARGLGSDFDRAAQQRRRHWIHAAAVRSVRCCQPAEGVAELSATVQAGHRVRAIAMRLETHEGRWRCTRLIVG